MHHVNGDFYATSATVIPVLYLAMTVQSTTYQTIIDRLRSSVRESEFKLWPQVRTTAWIMASFTCAAIILLGVVAEYLALHALYYQSSSPVIEQTVLTAAVGLLALTAVGPLYTFFSAHVGALMDNLRVAKERKASKSMADPSGDPGLSAAGRDRPETRERRPEVPEHQSKAPQHQSQAPQHQPEVTEHHPQVTEHHPEVTEHHPEAPARSG